MAKQLFLVSSPFTEPGKPLNKSNQFVERLLKCLICFLLNKLKEY